MQGMIRGIQNAAGIQWTEGPITLAVTSAGSDTAAGRPQRITSGDWSALPFATVQAAYDALPKGINHDVVISQGSGTFDGFVAIGFQGGGRIRHVGTMAAAVLTSGPTSGTAGSGTTTTSVALPAEAEEWTADELRGKFFVVTGGAGAGDDPLMPVIRPILGNFGSVLVVDAVPDMDDTTEFEIVEPDTELTTAAQAVPIFGFSTRAAWINCGVRIEAQQLAVDEDATGVGICCWGSRDVNLDGVSISSSSGAGLQTLDCYGLQLTNAVVDGVVEASRCMSWAAENICQQAGGRLDCQYINALRIATDGLGCTSTAVSARHCQSMYLKANLNDCTQIPIDLYNCSNFTNGGLDGANPTAPYYMIVAGGGQYIVVGATGSGAGPDDFALEGRGGTWAALSGSQAGTYVSRGTFLHWGSTGYAVFQTKLRVAAGVSGDDFEEFITNNSVLGGSVRYYGIQQFLNPAYKQISAYAGGGQALATPIGFVNTIVTTVATAGDSVRMLDDSLDTAYAGGLQGTVANAGANALDFYPPAALPSGGRQLILAGIPLGADQPYRLAPGHRLFWQVRNDLDIDIFLLGQTVPQKIISGTTYTMTAADCGHHLVFTSGSAVTVTIPDTLPVGWWVDWEQGGSGQVDFSGSAVTPATLNNRNSHEKSAGQYAVGVLRSHGVGAVTLSGDTSA